MTHSELVKKILDELTKEYGDETFVCSDFGYYQDAHEKFAKLLDELVALNAHDLQKEVERFNYVDIEYYWPEGIASRLESLKTEESRKLYVDEKDVGYLYWYYLEHVEQLLQTIRLLQAKVKALKSAQTPPSSQAKEKESCACKVLTKSGPLTPEMMERAFFPERFADKEPPKPSDNECTCNDCNICVTDLQKEVERLKGLIRQIWLRIPPWESLKDPEQFNGMVGDIAEWVTQAKVWPVETPPSSQAQEKESCEPVLECCCECCIKRWAESLPKEPPK